MGHTQIEFGLKFWCLTAFIVIW